MKKFLRTGLFFLIGTTISLKFAHADVPYEADESTGNHSKILQISATIDGSDRLVFTRTSVRLEHKFWQMPANVMFDGKPWTDFSQTPLSWGRIGAKYDLARAHIVERTGRDVVALERTPDGFDLYLDDSPNGADDYTVTIAIPRRKF
jgi:hypothetical protein